MYSFMSFIIEFTSAKGFLNSITDTGAPLPSFALNVFGNLLLLNDISLVDASTI